MGQYARTQRYGPQLRQTSVAQVYSVGVFDHPHVTAGLLIHHQALQSIQCVRVCVCLHRSVTVRMRLMNYLYAVMLHDSTILAH